jgi:glycolate oxidase subunit GlcD
LRQHAFPDDIGDAMEEHVSESRAADVRSALSAIVGSGRVRSPRSSDVVDDTEGVGLRGHADAVVEPSTAEQAAEIVAWCYRHDLPITPRGAGTGYAGGAVPQGGVVLSTARLTRIRRFDPELWRMEVEAGVLTATVQRRAREEGLTYPVDPGSQESSTIGGNVATNAGGPHSFKYGVTRAWVTGLEVVLAPGELVHVGGPVRKDVAGYDLTSLLVGAEGTLGLVTAAWLRLVPAPGASYPVVALVADARQGQEAVQAAMVSGSVPAALEFVDGGALAAAPAPFLPAAEGFLVIAEADGTTDEEARAARADLLSALEGVAYVHAPTSRSAAADVWHWRDGIGHAVSARHGGKLSEDIGVPVDRLADAVEATVAIGARHGLDAVSWGHAGDGNVHATLLLDHGDPSQRARAHAAAEELFALALELGGTVSGEHGIGVLKNGQLSRQWAPAAIAAHRSIKIALDPRDLFNPGKKLP